VVALGGARLLAARAYQVVIARCCCSNKNNNSIKPNNKVALMAVVLYCRCNTRLSLLFGYMRVSCR